MSKEQTHTARPKILFITTGCFHKAGIARYSRYQVTALRELFGPENVRVLTLWGPDESCIEEDFEVKWSGTGPGLKSKLQFSSRVIRESLAWKPDVIQTGHVNFSGMAHILSRLAGAKSLLNVYGREVWSGLSRDAEYGFRHIERIISDCHYTEEYILDNGIREKAAIDVIWDCVDLEKFKPSTEFDDLVGRYGLPSKDNTFIVGTLGRLSDTAMHKGYERLLEVIAIVRKRGYDKVRLIICGFGNRSDHLRSRARELGIDDTVVFTGAIDEQDMSSMYSYMDLFSLVSDSGKGRGEGIPLTPLEAMGCGVPVLVGNQDGSQEAVIDNRNGRVLEPFDLEAHALQICALMDDPTLHHGWKHEARKVAEEYFSYPAFKNKLGASYKKLLD